jgi:hypothetical protein
MGAIGKADVARPARPPRGVVTATDAETVAMLPSLTLLHDIGTVLGQVSPVLVPPAMRARIQAFAARIPSMDGGFEVRLHDSHAPIDISVCATPSVRSDLRVLAGEEPGAPLPPVLLAHPAWRHAVAQARELLARAGGQPPQEVLWLEFDEDVLDDDVPAPSVMVQRTPQGRPDLVEEAVGSHRILRGEDPPAGTLAALHALRAAMPATVVLPNLGVMTGRAGLPLRLRLHGWAPAALAATLAGIWGPAAAEPLRQAAAVLGDVEPVPAVTLDLHSDRAPKIGLPLQCWIGPGAAEDARRRLDQMLALLVDAGLCLPEMAEGLRAWPGWVHDSRPAAGLPHRRADGAIPVLARALVQFKLGFDDGALRAKAYFGVVRRCVPPPKVG